MKKMLMTAAVLACAASIVSAQTVASANIVGYNKMVNAGEFDIVAAQFDGGDNTLTGLFGDSLPEGSKIYKFSGGTYQISTYADVFISGVIWSPDFTLNQSESFWVAATATATNIFSGEVEGADSVTNSVIPGFQMLAYPYPVQRSVEQLEFSPAEGDKIYKFSGGTYQISTYADVFISGVIWSPSLTLEVGEGFWYDSLSGSSTDWIANKPF
ncbi:MAG: hypothetical protein V3U62_10790 [Sedimenticolaceae bacterium]